MKPMPGPTLPRAARLGRRLGIALFAALVSIPTVVWSLQIMKVVWSPSRGPEPESCQKGQLGLLRAVGRAREAAGRAASGERESLARFRDALAPEWDSRPNLDELCRAANERTNLQQIDSLRYAEEHAVRYEATALARDRKRARDLERALESP
jgi:acyl-CoA synthetase (NDP forming)